MKCPTALHPEKIEDNHITIEKISGCVDCGTFIAICPADVIRLTASCVIFAECITRREPSPSSLKNPSPWWFPGSSTGVPNPLEVGSIYQIMCFKGV